MIIVGDPGFPWEAVATAFVGLATLITGGLAVGAAWWVGQKQAEISRRQTEISAGQLALSELTLREKLFDRRIAVYEALKSALENIVARQSPLSPEALFSLVQATLQLQFLFRPDVHEKLADLLRRILEYQQCQPPERTRLTAELLEELKTLPERFGDELKLFTTP